MSSIEYPAIMMSQVDGGRKVVFFSAPATEIESWAGIPQKKGGVKDAETVGFQRDENQKRIDSIVSFLRDPRNIIQNPLLCATQSETCGQVRFAPDPPVLSDRVQTGKITIDLLNFAEFSLLDLMKKVKTQLELRVPELAAHHVDVERINELKRQANLQPPLSEAQEPEEDDEESEENEEEEETQEAAEVVFSDESHVLDFWHELSARIQVLHEMATGFTGDEFLGFSREAMTAFLKPIVVMDGQHRLRGALYAARSRANEEPIKSLVEQAIESGGIPSEVAMEFGTRVARWLPVSLLLSNDPAEHVFQFIVVNQKATPIGKALLGTIVSTTLSNNELHRVSERLNAADIKLEQSRAVAFLNRNPSSPFRGFIETGMAGETADRLAWSVMASLVKIFQKLKGGKLFGQKIDYADKWRRTCLDGSGMAAVFAANGFDSPFAYWSSNDGPWRSVFIAFYTVIRDEFGKPDPESWACWGNSRKSNLFNKISLTILAADFFQFLVDRRLTIDSPQDLPGIVEDWLQDVSRDYFNRDWNLANTKKDSVGIRGNWAKLWVDYRKDPQRMPKSSEYKKNL